MSPTRRPRLLEWAGASCGCLAVLTPLVLTTDEMARAALWTLGGLIAAAGAWALARPASVAAEAWQAGLGAALLASPRVLGYTPCVAAHWAAFCLGTITAAAGMAAMPLARRAQGRGP